MTQTLERADGAAARPSRPRAALSVRWPPLASWLPLLGLVLLAAGLRWFRISAQSLWYDEGISAHQLTRSFLQIIPAAAQDTHPPLYYLTLKAWGEVFGASELALRSLSAVWGTLLVVLTYLLGRRLFGQTAAVVAAVLLAVAPLAVYYSQEVRMYTQVSALGVLAAYGYARRAWWLYALAGILTLYSQYLGIAVLAATNLHWLLLARGHRRRDWLAWLVANLVIALAFAPWLPTFIAQQSHALNVSPRTVAGLLHQTLTAYGGGIVAGETPLVGGALLVLLAGLGVALGLWRSGSLDDCRVRCGDHPPPPDPLPRSSGEGENYHPPLPETGSGGLGGCGSIASRSGRGGGVLLAGLLWLLPLGLVLGLGLRSGLYEVRYLVVSLPGLALLAGLGVARITREPIAAGGLTLALLVPLAIALNQQYFDPGLARDDYRGLVQAIEQDARPGDAILLSAPNQIEVFSYYYHGPLEVVGLPAQRPIDPADTIQRLEALKRQHSRVWLVSWAMNEADPQGVIATWLAQNGFQASHAWFGTLQLALISFAPEDAPLQPLHLPLDNGIDLLGYRVGSTSLEPGQTLALTLVWQARAAPTERWKVFTHLLDAADQVVAQRDAEPADNLRPTTTWQAGETVTDNYGIVVPPDLAPGVYSLEVGMYDGEKRATFAGRGNHLVLGQITVR